MKKVLLLILAICAMTASMMALVRPVFADSCSELTATGAKPDPLLCPPESGGEDKIVDKVRKVLVTVYGWVGIIAVIVIVISGVRYIVSQGNPEAVKKAKSGILYASIGLIVTIAAFAITTLILKALGAS